MSNPSIADQAAKAFKQMKEDLTPNRQRIVILKELVMGSLEQQAVLNRAEQRALDYLNDGLLWLMENERALFMKGASNGAPGQAN